MNIQKYYRSLIIKNRKLAKVNHKWRFFHDEVAWNDRMPNINAALGCAQLEVLHNRLQKQVYLVV